MVSERAAKRRADQRAVGPVAQCQQACDCTLNRWLIRGINQVQEKNCPSNCLIPLLFAFGLGSILGLAANDLAKMSKIEGINYGTNDIAA